MLGGLKVVPLNLLIPFEVFLVPTKSISVKIGKLHSRPAIPKIIWFQSSGALRKTR